MTVLPRTLSEVFWVAARITHRGTSIAIWRY